MKDSKTIRNHLFFLMLFFSTMLQGVVILAQRLPYARVTELKNLTWDSAGYQKYAYNSDSLMTLNLSQEYYTPTHSWRDLYAYHMRYDNNGNQTEIIRLDYDAVNSVWDSATRIVNTYNPSGLILHHEFQIYGNGWETFTIDSSFYNSMNDIITEKTYYNDGLGIFYYGNKFYSYNGSNELLERLFLWYDTTSAQWDTIDRITYRYHTSPRVDTLISENYDAGLGAFIPSSKVYQVYHNNGEIEFEERLQWSVSSTSFEPSSNQLVSFHTDDAIDQLKYQIWNAMEEAYEDFSRSTFLYSTTTGIDSQRALPELLMYPNPTSDRVYFNSPVNITDYRLFSVHGKVMDEGKVENQQINTTEIPDGVYHLNVMMDNKWRSLKLVVQHE